MKAWLVLGLCLVLLTGCASTAPAPASPPKEAEDALKSVAEAISGKELTEEQVKELKDQIQHDPEAQSAIQAISTSVSSQPPRLKYSPATGKRYAPEMEVDPETGVPLEWVK